MEAIGGPVETAVHPHLSKNENINVIRQRTDASNGASSWTETDLPALQPNILQLIVNHPVPPQTREEASETGSTHSESLKFVVFPLNTAESGEEPPAYPCTVS